MTERVPDQSGEEKLPFQTHVDFHEVRPGRVTPEHTPSHGMIEHGGSRLARKLYTLIDLPEWADRELGRLEAVHRRIGRGKDMVVQGRPYSDPCILISGSAIRYKVFPDGRRQIVNFVLPGDIIGLRGVLCQTAFNSVTTIEDSVVAPFKPDQIHTFFRRSPELAGALFWLSALEQTLISERFVSIGRGNAYERLGFLLLECWERLCLVGLNEGTSFRLPLTHEILADALGLSCVHVGRVVKVLRDEGLLRFERGRVTLTDPDRLASKCDFQTGYILRVGARRIAGQPA